MLVDSHCHLEFDDFKDDFTNVLSRAKENGVERMLTIGTRLEKFYQIIKIAGTYEHVFCSVGLHPSECRNIKHLSKNRIVALCGHPKVVGIGETGLDYHYGAEFIELQKEYFQYHIEAAQETGLTLIVHTRDAEEDTYNILEKNLAIKPFRAVIHCFTGTKPFAQKVLDLGLYISSSGIVTFKNATEIQEVIRTMPLDKLLVETDSPYLAPVPHRGKRNEPAYVKTVAEFIANMRSLDYKVVANATTENFYKLFDKVKR